MRLRVAVAGVLVVLGAAAAFYVSAGSATPDDVLLHDVREEVFVRRVIGEGNLRAVVSTPLAPSRLGGSWGPMKIAWLAPDGTEVRKGDVVMRFDPTDYEKQLKDGMDDRRAAQARLRKEHVHGSAARTSRRTTAEMAELELEQTRRFKAKDPELFSRNQLIESEIDESLSEARVRHADAARRIESELVESKTELIEIDRQKADLTIAQAKAGLEALEIRAPHDGTFVLERDRMGNLPRVGEQAWPGQTIATLPRMSGLEAEIYVLEADGGGLKEGQRASVVVEADPDRAHEGRVKRVEKLARPRQRGLPVQYFGVVVELDETHPERMKPGQRVRGTITVEERTAIVVPRQAVFDRDGKRVVYRFVGGPVATERRFEAIEVALGPGTWGRVVVEKGITPGDRVALRDPTRTLESRDADRNGSRTNGRAGGALP